MTADELLSALGPGWEVRDHAIRPALLGDRSLVFATIRGLEAFQLSGLAAFARPVVEVEDFHGAIVAPSCYTVTIRDGDGAIVAGDLAASAPYTLTVQAADGNAGAYTDSATASFTCPLAVFVDAGAGDDANDGFASTSAFQSIQRAIDLSESGAIVFVAAGIYEPVYVHDKTLTIIGADAASTVIDGDDMDCCATLSSGTTLRNFTIRNGLAAAEDGTLEDCIVENCSDDRVLLGTDTIRCIVRNSLSWGSCVIDGGVHRNTLFHGLSGHYIFGDSTLYNCTVANNAADWGDAEDYHIGEQNPEYDSGQLFCGGSRFNCIVWDNTRSEGLDEYLRSIWSPCPENDAADPVFLDPGRGNFRLRGESPAIDSGNSAYAPQAGATDLDGRPRVQGAAIDRGCYEGPGLQGIRIAASAEGHGAVSPGCAYVQGPAESVLFTADTSVWGCPVVAWLTNGVLAAEGGDTFRIDGVTEDVAVTVKFAPGTLYVDASGNDSNDGSSPARALRTLQRAINVSGSGDTIRVASGGYSPIDVGGRALTIVGAGAGSTTIDGGGRNRCATLTPETTLRGFTLRNGIAKGWVLDSYIWESTDWNSVVKFGTLEDCVVENCQAEQSAAVFFWTSTRRCIVRNCRAKEFIVFGGVHANSLFHGNESEDMPVLQAIESYNCTFFSNATQYAWFLDGFPIVNSIRWNNSYSLSGMAPVQQNSTNDPMFVDAPAGNFRLRRGSPAIDAGISPTNQLASGCGSIDLEGKPRLQGETFDLGCYESPASDGYAFWSWMWGLGAWNATDASGVHNVFRYLFDKPSGTFENPPLLSISFDASGRAVIHTPPLNPSATGFDISILALDDLAGTGATTYPLDASGETVIPANSPARFFRLRAVEK
jgi:hypothetical protein